MKHGEQLYPPEKLLDPRKEMAEMTVAQFIQMLKGQPSSGKLVTLGLDLKHFDVITGIRLSTASTPNRAVIVIDRRRSGILSVVSKSTRERAAHSSVEMRFTCPRCNQPMRVRVGLTLKNGLRTIECVRCHQKLTPLVHGPIVAGPHAERHPRPSY